MREQLVDELFEFMPVIRKKLFKEMHNCNISRQQGMLMYYILKDDKKPIKYYGEKLLISKPNMTKLVDRLVDDGLIERIDDESDRRKIKLAVTELGRKLVIEHKEYIKNNILERINILDDKDIEELHESILKIKLIFSKL